MPKKELTLLPVPVYNDWTGFSACGGPLLRTNFLPLYSDPCGAFFMS